MSEEPKKETVSISELRRIQKETIFDIIADKEDLSTEKDDVEIDTSGDLIAYLSLLEIENEIESDIESANVTVENQLEELENEIADKEWLGHAKHIAKRSEQISEASGKIVEFYVTCSMLIEKRSIELIKKELISDRYKTSEGTNKLIRDNMNQEMRESLMLRTGIISKNLQSELAHVRTVRNNLVHNVSESIFVKGLDDILSEIRRAIDTLGELDEVRHDNDVKMLKISISDDNE